MFLVLFQNSRLPPPKTEHLPPPVFIPPQSVMPPASNPAQSQKSGTPEPVVSPLRDPSTANYLNDIRQLESERARFIQTQSQDMSTRLQEQKQMAENSPPTNPTQALQSESIAASDAAGAYQNFFIRAGNLQSPKSLMDFHGKYLSFLKFQADRMSQIASALSQSLTDSPNDSLQRLSALRDNSNGQYNAQLNSVNEALNRACLESNIQIDFQIR